MPTTGRFLMAILLPILVPSALFWPMANFYWTLFSIKPFDPVTGADPVYVSAPVADLTATMTDYTWRLFPGFPEVIGGALLAIAIFALVDRKWGVGSRRDTLCRCCRRILRNLDRPECPACGAAL